MNDVRKMTAAELAADSETAREVWAAWGRKEVDITTAFLDRPVLDVKVAPNGDVRLRTGSGWQLEAGSVTLCIRPRVPPPPTYDELLAERNRYKTALETIAAMDDFARYPQAPRIAREALEAANERAS